MLDYYNSWRLSHFLSIFAHIFLWLAGILAFATAPRSSPEINITLPFGGSAIGMFGAAGISIFFAFTIGVQKPSDESNQDRSFNIKLVFATSMVAHLLLIAADITIAVFTATKTRHGGVALAAFGTLAAISGFITLGTVIADIIYLRGLDAQTYSTNIINMHLLETDEE